MKRRRDLAAVTRLEPSNIHVQQLANVGFARSKNLSHAGEFPCKTLKRRILVEICCLWTTNLNKCSDEGGDWERNHRNDDRHCGRIEMLINVRLTAHKRGVERAHVCRCRRRVERLVSSGKLPEALNFHGLIRKQRLCFASSTSRRPSAYSPRDRQRTKQSRP